jgi:hypothetical protein
MARIKSVKHHILRDAKSKREVIDTSLMNPDDAVDQEIRNNRISFTCLLAHPDGYIYCGITAFKGDIFWRFDPRTGKFADLGYNSVGEQYEVKIHRSLELASDGTIYGASATLYTLDQRQDTVGGAIFHYDPRVGKIEKLVVPCERDYIQTITLDEKRQLVYGMCCPVYKFFVYNIATNKVQYNDYMGSITHIGAIDDAGCYWGTWDSVYHYLFKYDPATGKITYFHHSIPEGKECAGIMYPGAGPVDTMINGRDSYLYIGTCGGTLVRLDPKTAKCDYLARPQPTRRMPGLVIWHDSVLIGAGGDNQGGYIFTYDRKTGAVQNLGKLVDPTTGEQLFRVHDLRLSLDGKTAYVAETDVPSRSGYLWQVELEQ